jgi:ankyrin repeat protein
VQYLVEQRGAEVNQHDRASGATPLHRAARLAHDTSRPYMRIFEYLLEHGADPALLTDAARDHLVLGRVQNPRDVSPATLLCAAHRADPCVVSRACPATQRCTSCES